MSESNQVILKYVPETTYNTTPTDSADWKTIRYTSETLSASPSYSASAEIRSDRQIVDNPVVSAAAQGDFSFEFSPQSFDDFIESAMCSTFDGTTGELKTGTADSSYSMEKEFADISKFITFTGMRVGTMSLEMSYGSIQTGSFSFMGAGADTPATSAVGAGTLAAPLTTPVYVGSSDVGSVEIDETPTSICISSMSLTIENNLRMIECLGSLYATDVKKGTSNVSGSMELYLDADSFNLYKTSLESGRISVSYVVTDGTNSYEFNLPNLTLEIEAPQSSGLDTDVTLTANFTALYDATAESNLVITRTPV